MFSAKACTKSTKTALPQTIVGDEEVTVINFSLFEVVEIGLVVRNIDKLPGGPRFIFFVVVKVLLNASNLPLLIRASRIQHFFSHILGSSLDQPIGLHNPASGSTVTAKAAVVFFREVQKSFVYLRGEILATTMCLQGVFCSSKTELQ